jgi:hypothetical protein
MKSNRFPILTLPFIFLTVQSCSSPSFDSQSFEQSKLIKEESLSLMDKAAEPFPDHRASVETLKSSVDAVFTHERARSGNDEKVQMWEVIMDSTGNSLYGFLARWEREGTLGAGFITEAKRLVAAGFDQMIELEEGRK